MRDALVTAGRKVVALARRASLGPRQVTRRFRATFGTTPADFVETVLEKNDRLTLGQPDEVRIQAASPPSTTIVETLAMTVCRRVRRRRASARSSRVVSVYCLLTTPWPVPGPT